MQFPERIFSASSLKKSRVANYKRVVNTLSNSKTLCTETFITLICFHCTTKLSFKHGCYAVSAANNYNKLQFGIA